ncbi:class I SAM-dependent methyltransferase [Patescibacteria group bacterium]|nr:class I SAM-dependent methyltransferase [Patescibacteria group bacterium]MBU1921720.1 class I SAM-dependent methyltransferase [Patescibacteria group bacterium]
MSKPVFKKFFEDKLKKISIERNILDLGGGSPFQHDMAEYRDWFKNSVYKTMDYDTKYNPDIVGDIHNIPLEDGSVDAIICKAVLEHVEAPHQAVQEMYRVLRSGGKILVYVPSIYPYHANKPSYSDYWRFFDDTLRVLFKDFINVEIIKVGGYFRMLSAFCPLFKKPKQTLEPVANFLDRLFKMHKRTSTAGYYLYAEKKL